MTFQNIIDKYRKLSFSERDKGNRFERLIQAYLKTDPKYSSIFQNVWLWNEFFAKDNFGGKDTGIDLVAQTYTGEFWAIQCKLCQENTYIDKPEVDSFLATSSRKFQNEKLHTTTFSHRLLISTTNKWSSNAEEAIKNQNPPVSRISLYNLQTSAVNWEKLDKNVYGETAKTTPKQAYPHQIKAVEDAHNYFKKYDRGKLIMACGTGKTFTSLRIAENETNGKGLILFLVPSIALIGQTLDEWYADAKEPFNAICICSDPTITKKSKKNEDIDTYSVVDLALPASTNVNYIIKQFKEIENKKGSQLLKNKGMTVVFSTYHSIDVIAKAQKELKKELPKFAEFDLIICDEAHRTTGVTLSGEDETAFVKVHNDDFIRSKKRMYMTATPRLYSDDTKAKAKEADAILCSMDDEEMYGKEIYRIGFGEAVEKKLLTDYKVLILTLNKYNVPPIVQNLIAEDSKEINLDDASKLIGCINALSKQIIGDDDAIKATSNEPMKRTVAFCASIKNSKSITNIFNETTSKYISALPPEKQKLIQHIKSQHIDGTMNAMQRNELMAWLKDEPEKNECRVLTNVRCLSEGVDVPSLDAVMFLSAKNSQIDVVQSVGRVMRIAPNKNYGYIIIPIVVPFDIDANEALDDNERYKVVWTVLNALRAHDDRFNATVNKIELNKNKPNNIIIGRPDISFDENGEPITGEKDKNTTKTNIAEQLAMQFEQLQTIIFARMVQKVGERRYWEQWAKSVAEIADKQIKRIANLIKTNEYKNAFEKFLLGLQKNINPSILEQDAIEMLSQHIITKPVFEALFENYSFVKNNPISVSMQTMLNLLESQKIEEDTQTLQKFYDSVKTRVSNIDNAKGKQTIITELYDKFFKTAFPKMVERLGIVYTPIEVVDFIIQSVNEILIKEFGRTVSNKNVNILDPFTGTGTFITRLIQSGLIEKKDLKRKYQHELFANEIVLLAYYIAAVNIENAFHDEIMGYGGQGLGYEGQGLGYGEQGIEDENFKSKNKYDNNSIIQGIDSMAGGNESCRNGICGNAEIPERRNVWADEPNTKSSSIHSGEYSGGIRSEEQSGISEFSIDSQRFTDGVGNTFVDSNKSKLPDCSENGTIAKSTQFCRTTLDSASQISVVGFGGQGLGYGEQGIEDENIPQTPNPIPHTPYTPFDGICLTDTFQINEYEINKQIGMKEHGFSPENTERIERQKNTPITVIMGNPPYSIGQKSANDNAQNQAYPNLDARIAETYAKLSSAGLNKSLYDAYIKAFRWSSDRLKNNEGIIAFVSNGAWLDGNSADGFRKSLETEFSSIYVFNLRGNARTSGELRQKEAGNAFGSGSRTPIAITILVKKKENFQDKAKIYYHDIGDYLTREEKLNITKQKHSIANIQWQMLSPNEHGDWLNQRNDAFSSFIPLEPEKKFDANTKSFFVAYSLGTATNRDAWVYNFSVSNLKKNIKKTIAYYNEQLDLFLKNENTEIQKNSTKGNWTRDWDNQFKRRNKIVENSDEYRIALHRPFTKQNSYFDDDLNQERYQLPKLFPTVNHKNLVICVPGVGNNKDFSVFITNVIPDLQIMMNGQCFPLYYYEDKTASVSDIFDSVPNKYVRRDGISDYILERVREQYRVWGIGYEGMVSGVASQTLNPIPRTLTKEDIFYYVYGFLHSRSYRETFSFDLKKMLPRLPLVDDVRDFWLFSDAGRELADLHLHYEQICNSCGVVVLYTPLTVIDALKQSNKSDLEYMNYRVSKMRFLQKDRKDTIIFNSQITVENIPLVAYDYIVNGKSAIEWIMERYQISTHKDSGILNDPNDWSLESKNPRYILDLLLSVINLSVRTVSIVNALPCHNKKPNNE